MDIGKKAIVSGAVLFFLGGLSMYFLMAPPSNSVSAASVSAAKDYTESQLTTATSSSATINDTDGAPEMTHAAFLAEAEARREKNLQDKAEAERIEKLLKEKQNSVECKFWKQQQKTSSAAARIEERIDHFCNLPAAVESEPSDREAQGAAGDITPAAQD